MRPVPVAFHIGPLEVHTYGIGLAVTFCLRLLVLRAAAGDPRLPHRLADGGLRLGHRLGRGRGPGAARARQPRLLLVASGPDPGHLAGRAVVVRRPALRGPGGSRPHPAALPRAADHPGPRRRGARAHGRVEHGSAPRAPAHGGGRGSSHDPVVRHVLRRAGRQAPAGPGLPGPGGLRRVLRSHPPRAAPGPLA